MTTHRTPASAPSILSPTRRHPGLNGPLARAALFLALATAWPAASLAQYMYLDSNGDGVNTAADQVSPSGPMTFDIWLDTGSNRDGSTVVCPEDPSNPISILGYAFTLRAAGGTVAWSGFTNTLPISGSTLVEQSSNTEYANSFIAFPPSLPGGLHRLAYLTVTVLSGAPAIQIVESAPTLPRPDLDDGTGFGSQCVTRGFDNYWQLGRDWFDVDGLAPGAPTLGHPPVLAQPAAISAPVGAVTKQALAATDADGQPVSFTKVAGPGYLWIETLDTGRGIAAGEAVVAPIYSDVGTSNATVEVTDGVSVDRKSFDITVTPMPNRAPVLTAPGRAVVVAGTTARLAITATDVDGQPLEFSRVAGPGWAVVTTLNPGRGGAAGDLRLTPTPHDVGRATIVVSASDGVAAAERTVDVEVIAPQSVPPSPVLPFPLDSGGDGPAIADLNGDGTMDLISGSILGDVSVSLGRGDGSFLPSIRSGLGDPVLATATGDVNGDGRLDVAVTLDVADRLVILLGNGDGSLSRGPDYAVVGGASKVALRDLDTDGALDVVVANSYSTGITVYLGRGDGSFHSRRDFATGSSPIDLALADFDADGRVDVATANLNGRSVTLLFGRGDGTFGRRADMPIGSAGYFAVASDFNWDGITDLGVSAGANGVQAWIGAGDGTFQPAPAASGPARYSRGEAVDWDADGKQDLVLTDEVEAKLTVAYGAGDGTFPTRDSLGPGRYLYLAIGDLNRDAFPDAVSGAVILNSSSGLKAVQARAFLENTKSAVSIAPSGPDLCVYLEPVDQSFSLAQVDMASVTLSSAGTGIVDRIHAAPGGSGTEGDIDRNGIADMPVCFAAADLRQLFGAVKGRLTVPVRLEGGLATGQHFNVPLVLTIVGIGKPFAVMVTPNPLNPSGTITVTTSTAGFLRVRLYDLHGRLVRSIADVQSAPAGAHDFRVGIAGPGGRGIASGVYFLRVETAEGTLRARVAVLK